MFNKGGRRESMLFIEHYFEHDDLPAGDTLRFHFDERAFWEKGVYERVL